MHGNKKTKKSDAINIFHRLIERYSYKNKNGRDMPLTNITFFLGAGFSKSWDDNYPLGEELFKFQKLSFNRYFEAIEPFVKHCGFDPCKEVDFDIFAECYYKLEMLKKYPQIRPRYIDNQTISIIDSEFKSLIWQKLDDLVNLNYLEDGSLSFRKTTDNQNQIISFFRGLFDQTNGSTGIPEGLRINFITTNYDYIIEGILDSHSELYEDSHYYHTYRGFTPKLINGNRNDSPLKDHWLVNNLIKINGGLEIRQNESFFNIDHRKKTIKDILDIPPEIMLPSKEQNYTSDYFNSIFSKAARLLQESRIIVIVGYSFPKEDALIRFILRHFAEDGRDLANKVIFYIDCGNEVNLKDKVKTICPTDFDYGSSIFAYGKGFLNFVKAVNKIGMP